MAISDLLGHVLMKIRNANSARKLRVYINYTDLNLNVVKILKEEGFILSFDVFSNRKSLKFISVSLKYKGLQQLPYITSLVRVSKPGFRVYVRKTNIPKVLGGVGIVVLSTSKGILTDFSARANEVGGEVLFYIW